MKRSLLFLLALGLFAVIPLAAQAQQSLGNEDLDNGLYVQTTAIPGVLAVGSDGEQYFDPFGYGHDTSDGIQFSVDARPVPGTTTPYWVQLKDATGAPTNTWVLPGDLSQYGWGVENNVTFEPLGQWILPGITVTGQHQWVINDADGTVGDLITISPAGTDGALLTFQSDPVPEPGCVVAIVGMCGMGLAGFVWRRRTA
jgi:hypothetical protein